VEDIGLSELETLIGFYNAIKEGEVRIDEAFPPITAAKTDDLKGPGAPITGGAPTPAAAPGATQQAMPAPLPPVVCRYCQQPVPDIANHECEPMRAAINVGKPAPETPTATPAPTAEPPAPAADADALNSVALLAKQSGITEDTLLAFCKLNKLAKPTQTDVSQLATGKLMSLIKTWQNILPELQRIQSDAATKN
jgi:hypothetical protein